MEMEVMQSMIVGEMTDNLANISLWRMLFTGYEVE